MQKGNEFTNISYFFRAKITRQNILEVLKESASNYAKGSLIDMGCGMKPYENIFQPYVASYFGIDYPTFAEANYKEMTKADLFIDCTDTKLNNESFDTLLCTQVIEHIFETEKFIRECYRLLKKNGIGIFTIPFVYQSHAEPYDYFRFTKYSLEKLFSNAGFFIESIRPLEGSYATIKQLKILSFYNILNGNTMIKKIIRGFWTYFFVPILNWQAIHLDKYFYDEKLCLNYLLIVKK
jgi:SAM-dependent methyltransferase